MQDRGNKLKTHPGLNQPRVEMWLQAPSHQEPLLFKIRRSQAMLCFIRRSKVIKRELGIKYKVVTIT